VKPTRRGARGRGAVVDEAAIVYDQKFAVYALRYKLIAWPTV
jgi:hypothetical protein